MYKPLILAATLGLGLVSAPAVMAKPEPEERRGELRYQRDHDTHRSVQESRHGVRVEREHRQDWGRREHRDERRGHDRQHDRRAEAYRDRDHGYRDHGHRDQRYRYESRRDYGHDHHRGYHRGHHRWSRGERIPVSYRSHRYVVHDYHAHRLYTPPRGHHWVRVDQDFVLTAVATGVIAAVVYGALY